MTSINIDDFPIEIDSVFLSLVIDYYRFLSIVIDFVTSISIDFRDQSILIGRLNGLISMISTDFRYRFLSINHVGIKAMLIESSTHMLRC